MGWAILFAIVAALAGLANIFDKTQWAKDHTWVRYSLVSLLAAMTLIEAIRQIIQRHKWHIEGVRAEPVRSALHTGLVAISEETKVPVQDLGVSVFQIKTEWWEFWKGPTLQRVDKVRLAGPSSTDVDWTKGKGAIGQCWDQGVTIHRYWAPIVTRYGIGGLTESAWKQMGKADKSGFTKEEFLRFLPKYSEIIASPIVDPRDGRIKGVLSFDLSRESSCNGNQPILSGPDVERLATETAKRVATTGAL